MHFLPSPLKKLLPNVQSEEGVYRFLNNVKKNCRNGNARHPLYPMLLLMFITSINRKASRPIWSLCQPTWLQSFLSIWTSPYITEPQPSKSQTQDVHPFFYFIFSAIVGNARGSFTYQYTNCLIASERCFSFIEMRNVLRKKLNWAKTW